MIISLYKDRYYRNWSNVYAKNVDTDQTPQKAAQYANTQHLILVCTVCRCPFYGTFGREGVN